MDRLQLASAEFVTVQILPKPIPGLTNEKLLPLAGLSAPHITNLVTVVDRLTPTQREAFAHKAAGKMGPAFTPAFKRDKLTQFVREKVYAPLKDNLPPDTVTALREEILKPTNNNLSILTAFLCAPEQNQANARIRLWNVMLETMTQAALQQGILTVEDLKKGDLYLSAALSQSYPLLFRPEEYEGKTLIEAMSDTAGEFLQNPEAFKLVSPEHNGRKPVDVQRREHTQRLSAWIEEERRNIGPLEGVVNIDKLRDEIKNIGKYKEHELVKPDFGQLALLEKASVSEKQAAILAILEPEKGLYYQIPEHRKSIYLLSNIARLCEDLPGEYKQLLALALCQEDRGLTTAVSSGEKGSLVLSSFFEGYDVTILRNADPEIRPFVHDFLLELVEKTYGTTNIDPEGKHAHPAAGLSNIFLLAHPDKEGLLRLFTLWDQHPDIDHLACLFSDQNSIDETFIPQSQSAFSHVYDRYNPNDRNTSIGNFAIDLLNDQEVSDRFMQHFVKLLNSLTTQEQRKSVIARFLGYTFRETRILPSSKYKAQLLEFWIKHTPKVHIKAGYGSEIFFEWRLEDLCDEHQIKDFDYYYTLDVEKAKRQAAEWKRKSEADTAISMHLVAGADMSQVTNMQLTLLEQREDFRDWLKEKRAQFQRLYDNLPTGGKFIPQRMETTIGELPMRGYEESLTTRLRLSADTTWGLLLDRHISLSETSRQLSKDNITHNHVVQAISDLHQLADTELFVAFTRPAEPHPSSTLKQVKLVTVDDFTKLPLDKRKNMATQLRRIQAFLEDHRDNPVFSSIQKDNFTEDVINPLLLELEKESVSTYLDSSIHTRWDVAMRGHRIIFTMLAIEARRLDLGVRIETSPDSFQVVEARSYQALATVQKYADSTYPLRIMDKITPVSLNTPLHPGERVWLTGPNGSGKTTAIQAILAGQYIAMHQGTPLARYVLAYEQPGIPKAFLAQAHLGSGTDANASLFQANVRTVVNTAPSGVVGLDEPFVGAPTEYRTPLALAAILRLGKGGAIVFIPTHEAPDFYLLESILGINHTSQSWMINPSTHEQMTGIGGSFGIEMARVVGLPQSVISNAYRVKDGLSANLETIELTPIKELDLPSAESKPAAFISDESLANLGFSDNPDEHDNVITALIRNALPAMDPITRATYVTRFWRLFKKVLRGENRYLHAIEKAESEPLPDFQAGVAQLAASIESLSALEIDQLPTKRQFFNAIENRILSKELYGDRKKDLIAEIYKANQECNLYLELVSQPDKSLEKLRRLAARLDPEEQKPYHEALARIEATLRSEQLNPEELKKQGVLRLKQFLEDHPRDITSKNLIKSFEELFKNDPQVLSEIGGKEVWEQAKALYESSNDLTGIYDICVKFGSPKSKGGHQIASEWEINRPYQRIFLATRCIEADRKSAFLNALAENNTKDIELINEVIDTVVFSHITAANTRPDSNTGVRFSHTQKVDIASGKFPVQFSSATNMAMDNHLTATNSDTRYKPQTMTPGASESVDQHYPFVSGTKILALTGVNAGGKSQNLRLAGQIAVLSRALSGRVPASEATVAEDIPYIFAAINTAKTGEGRSTFFNEMHSVLNMYQEFVTAGCPNGALILYDEPANGTSKDEKVALTVAILHSLEQMGAAVIITNHEGDVYKAMDKVKTNGDQLKYYPVAYQYTDNPADKYVLQHGMVGGSESAKIALENGMSQEEVELAEFLRLTMREYQENFTN